MSRALLGLMFCVSTANDALAVECSPSTGLSPCLDSNSLWLPAGTAHFAAIPAPEVPPTRQVAFSFSLQGQFGALELVVPSADPDGRKVRAVRYALEHDFSLALGLGHELELGVTLPVIAYQRGAGSQGLTSQRAVPLEHSALRDPRLVFGRAITLAESLAAKPQLRLTVPLGDSESYASNGSFVLAPALPFEWHQGRWRAGALLGARLRRAVDIGSLRWGSQAEISAGLSFDVLGDERLRVGVEGLLLPSLVTAASRRAQQAELRTRLLPAEWLGSVRATRGREDPWSLMVAAGSGLPLSTQASATDDSRFLAPTNPSLRVLAEIRYAPKRGER